MISLPPWAKDLEALICKEAKKGDNEQTAIKAACGEIAKKLPAVPESACEKVGGIVFDDALKKCPKVEAIISKEAKKGDNEQTAIKAACGEIAKKLPAVPENACEKVGGIVFDDALKKCPKDEAMISLPPW